MRVDALQKYRNQLLSAFNAEQLQYLKYDSWSGLLTETDRLYATMFHDWDVLQKDCSDLAEAVQTLEWTVAPYVKDGEKPDAKAQDVAKTVTDALWKRSPHAPGTYSHSFPQLINAIVHALFRGYNVHEIEWVNADGLVYPAAFHQLPAQFMRWEDRAGQVDRLLFIPDGETETPRPFPKNKYLVALNTSGPDHPLFNAMYYSLIAWYGAYKFGLGWFMEYCQKYGLPKLVFHYESESDRRQLEKDLAEERVLNNILLKGDRAVDIANAPASGASLPQRELLTLAESQCHKLILGQTLTSDTSQHGGSLAQAKVHAGVQAEVVKKRADFVADVLNSQLIPAIVLLNYGTLDVPMPELRYKIPQEGVTLERVQVVKTALEIKGMKLKKSEVYEFTGFAQPADGDEVFEAASAEGDMAGLAGLLGKGKPQDDTDPDDDPNKPKKAPVKENEDVEPVSAAKTDAPTDPAQEWLAPIKQKFLEARKAGASMADMRKMLLTMHPNTKALAKAFANNILAGFAGESEEVDAANPWGCNQYGHRNGHKDGESKKKESDDVYDFDNMEPDERLQKAIDDLGEVEEDDIDWDDYDKAQEVKKIFHPDNHKVPQWRKERMIQEVGNRVTDALRHLANVNKARRDFRNPNRPTEDDVARAEEAFGKAVHEWRRFHRARLEVQGWDKKAIDGYLSRWPEYMETANAEDIDAANPYGCNQYGEGWRMSHNGRASKVGAPVKKTDPTEEERKQKEEEERQRQEEQQRKEEEERKARVETEKKAKEKHPIGQATTKEEAIEHTRSLLPEDRRKKAEVHFDASITLHQINAFNLALSELVNKYPTPYLRKIGSNYVSNGGVLAFASPTSLEMNHDSEKNGIKAVGKLHKIPYYGEPGFKRELIASSQQQEKQMKAVITHEYGHVIFTNIKEEARNVDNKNYETFKEARNAVRAAYKKARKTGDIKNISSYANTDEDEFFCECFSAREMGEKLPDYINNALDKALKISNMK